MIISNARIESTFLGFEDHGIFTYILHVRYNEVVSQGVGMIALDHPYKDENGKFIGRFATQEGMQMIMDILETVGVDSWEKLEGRHIRIEHNGYSSTPSAIGHITEDRWFKIKG